MTRLVLTHNSTSKEHQPHVNRAQPSKQYRSPILNMTILSSQENSSASILPPYTPQNPFRLDSVGNAWSPLDWKSIRSVTSALHGPEITNEVLRECVELFNMNFGVWGELAQKYNPKAKPGSAVKTNIKGLRRQCVSCEAASTLVRHHIQGKFVGYAFATRWPYRKLKGSVCWITQVVVDQNYRGVGIATCLLRKLKTDKDVLFGIFSSHPAAIMALSRAISDIPISSIDLSFTQKHASQVLSQSNIDYLQINTLQGSLFKNSSSGSVNADDDGIVSCAETEFMIAHDEALWALGYFEGLNGVQWPLGDLHDYYEFVVLVENKDRVIRSS